MSLRFERTVTEWFLLFLAALAVVALIASAARAQSCGTVTRSYAGGSYTVQSYGTVTKAYKPTYNHHDDYVFTKFVAVIPLAEFPTYSAVYTPPAPTAAQLQQQANNDVLKTLQALKAQVDSLTKQPAVPSVQQPAPRQPQPEQLKAQPTPQPQVQQGSGLTPSVVSIVTNKCSQCHSEATAAEFGASFVMITQGKLEQLSAKAANKVIGKTHQNKMPPAKAPDGFTGQLPGPLTDEEAAVLIAHYTGQLPTEGRQEISVYRTAPRVVVRSRPK